jgi:hypothetical protein
MGWITPRLSFNFKVSSSDVTKNNCDEYLRNDPYYCRSFVIGSVPALLNGIE